MQVDIRKSQFKPEKNVTTFRNALLAVVEQHSQNDKLDVFEVSDIDLLNLASRLNTGLSLDKIKDIIYRLENKLGELYKIKLKRKTNWGYVALTPDEHANSWKEGLGDKGVRMARREAKRGRYINVDRLSADKRAEVALLISGVQSVGKAFKIIALQTSQMNVAQESLLSYAVDSLKSLSRVNNAYKQLPKEF